MIRAARPAARRTWHILLIHPDEAAVRLAGAALKDSGAPHVLAVVPDAGQALAALRQRGEPAADLILLDVSRLRTDGPALLAAIKGDAALRHIPIVVLSDSQAEGDVMTCYRLHANCYLHKPAGDAALGALLRDVARYWLCGNVVLPMRAASLPA